MKFTLTLLTGLTDADSTASGYASQTLNCVKMHHETQKRHPENEPEHPLRRFNDRFDQAQSTIHIGYNRKCRFAAFMALMTTHNNLH